MYKSSYKCSDCKKTFEKITKNFPNRDPSCPHCKVKKRGVSMRSSVSDKTHNVSGDTIDDMLKSKKAPGRGKSAFTKAMDTTADIVMQDYGMTNLKDNLRPGDDMVPPLPPELEKRVQNSWGGQSQRATQSMVNMNAVTSGAYRDQGDIVKAATSSGIKRPINYIE